LGENREEDGSEDRNNCDNNEQLNERECLVASHVFVQVLLKEFQ
jgi:hypothetical protein